MYGFLPEIAVEQPVGTNLAAGGTSDFGSVNTGESADLTFTIKNLGGAELLGIAATMGGTNASEFTITTAPPTTLAPGGSATFTVHFAPTSVAAKTAAISIASNDADENPFTINLTGSGATPRIAVEQPAGTSLANGGTSDFGSVNTGASADLTYTIKNTGSGGLHGIAVTMAGANAGDFTVTSAPPTTLAASGQATFTVHFAPSTAAAESAQLSIASNDPVGNPFLIALSGQGVAPSPAPPAGPAAAPAPGRAMAPAPAAVQALGQTVTPLANAKGGPRVVAAPGAPVVSRDPATGLFKLTLHLQKSADGVNFECLPLSAEQMTLRPDGVLEFYLPNVDDTTLFRMETE